MQVVGNTVDVEIARADRADIDVAADRARGRIARANAVDGHVALHVLGSEIARADAAYGDITMHLGDGEVARAHRRHLGLADIARLDVARVDLRFEVAVHAVDVEV